MNNSFFCQNITIIPETAGLDTRCSGQNHKGVLILLEASGNPDQLKSFLGKILSAVHLSIEEDVTILSLEPAESISLSKLKRKTPFSRVISFGIRPERLGVRARTSLYYPFQLGEISFLFGDPLQDIHSERQRGEKHRAGALWKALQEIFLPMPQTV